MDAHNMLAQQFIAPVEMVDPGTGKTIYVERSPCLVPLTSVGVETRTVANPTRPGAILTLAMKVDGGDITVTFSTAYDEAGTTTFVFSDPGQFIMLQAVRISTTVIAWRKISDHNIGSLTLAQAAMLAAITATAAEINQAADESVNSEVVITTNVIAAAESGATFYLTLAGGFTSTLPAPALGMRFRFIVAVAPTTAYIITTNAGADLMYGMMEERAGGAGVAGAARDTFNFVANQAKIGDWVEFWSDGTNWYYHGMVDVAAGNTVAAT